VSSVLAGTLVGRFRSQITGCLKHGVSAMATYTKADIVIADIVQCGFEKDPILFQCIDDDRGHASLCAQQDAVFAFEYAHIRDDTTFKAAQRCTQTLFAAQACHVAAQLALQKTFIIGATDQDHAGVIQFSNSQMAGWVGCNRFGFMLHDTLFRKSCLIWFKIHLHPMFRIQHVIRYCVQETALAQPAWHVGARHIAAAICTTQVAGAQLGRTATL
jgi:hypothetical protein